MFNFLPFVKCFVISEEVHVTQLRLLRRFLCAAEAEDGTASGVDLKGIQYDLVNVNKESTTLACFSGGFAPVNENETKVCCYCTPLF